MSQVIRIPDDLFKRLETHATGFVTPANVIEKLLNAYEGVQPRNSENSETELLPAKELEIIYPDNSEEGFKQELLNKKEAFITLNYTNGNTETKVWKAKKFNSSSRVDGNLRSGYLRGWKERGIFKAELSFTN